MSSKHVHACESASGPCQYDLRFYYCLIKTAFISIHKGAVLDNILIYRSATNGNKAHACVVYNC